MNGLRESASGIDTDLLSSAIADGDCAQAVEAEQTRLLYRHLPATLGASLLVAVAFAAVLWQALPGQSLSMWLGALAIVCGLRFVLLLRYRHSAGDGSADVWRRRFLMGTFAAGLVWGALGWFLLPAEGYQQAFVAFLLAGVTAGSATTQSPCPRAFTLFVLPAVLPFAARMLQLGDAIHFAMGAMTVLFAAFMLGVSARLGASIEESLRLRFSNLRLLRDLSGTNARLEQLNGALEFEVTERRSTQDVLRKSEEKLRLHAQQAPLAFIEWDLNFRAVEWNPAAERIFGWSREDALGRRASHLIAGDGTCDSIARLWQRLLVEKKGARILLDNRTRDGSVIQCEWYYTPLTDRDGRVLSVITLAQDVTASKEAEARLHYLAYHDNLTGLPNRALFADRLQQAMAEARRGGASVGVMLLDVDHFKVVNDTMGHEAGDNLLRDVATRLQQCVRGSDTVARFGGDEFALVLANLPDPANAFTVAQKVLDSFIPPFQVPGGEVYVAASIGIAFFPNDSETLDGLVRDVDSALYHAKAQGRNNFQCYSSDLTARAQVRLATETSLRRALERDEFRLHFQPKVDLGTGRVTGVEALLRWEDRDRGLVPPGDFIALAEDSGLIVPIGEWVLREACAEVRRWDAAGLPPMRLAVNLSSRQFRNQQFGATVDRILAETGFDPSRLEFEITESVLMDQDTRISAILGELKASGIGISIDDFGTGYSSLSYLKRFPVDTLKIDRSFVRDVPGDLDDVAIVRAIIAMARSLRMRTVAEGVELQEQLGFLRGEGCDEVQGYLCGRPVPGAELARLLRLRAAVAGL